MCKSKSTFEYVVQVKVLFSIGKLQVSIEEESNIDDKPYSNNYVLG